MQNCKGLKDRGVIEKFVCKLAGVQLTMRWKVCKDFLTKFLSFFIDLVTNVLGILLVHYVVYLSILFSIWLLAVYTVYALSFFFSIICRA